MSKVNPKDIEIEDTPEFTRITLRSDSFFESGRATITDKTRAQLEMLGETLAGRNQKITITGYTDSVPINTIQFPSNWELSAARAATVGRTFIYMGVDAGLVSIVGRADNDAIAPNDSPYGRSLNRRVIIMVSKK
jgi:chemotaxis protein MotB